MTMGKECAPPPKITVMSELYAVVYVICNVFPTDSPTIRGAWNQSHSWMTGKT